LRISASVNSFSTAELISGTDHYYFTKTLSVGLYKGFNIKRFTVMPFIYYKYTEENITDTLYSINEISDISSIDKYKQNRIGAGISLLINF